MRRVVVAAVSTALLAVGSIPSVAHGDEPGAPESGPFLMLTQAPGVGALVSSTDNATLYLADGRGIERGSVATQSITSFAYTATPSAVALSADGSTLFAAQPVTAQVGVYDTTTGQRLRVLAAPGIASSGIAISPDDSTLYLADKTTGAVDVLDATTGALERTLTPPPGISSASGLGLTDAGATLFVSDNPDGAIWTIDTATATTNVVLSGVSDLKSFAVGDDGVTAYLGIGGTAPQVETVDVAQRSVVHATPIAAAPSAMTMRWSQLMVAEPSRSQIEQLFFPMAPRPEFDTVDAMSGFNMTVGMTDTIEIVPPPAGFSATYQWFAGGRFVGGEQVGGELIPGATSKTIRLTSADLGASIKVVVTIHHVGMAPTSDWALDTRPVVAPMVPSAPAIAGRAAVGRKVTAKVPSWGAHTDVHFDYQWYAAGRPINGATKPSLRIKPAFRGRALRLRLTGQQYSVTRQVFSKKTKKVRR